MKLTILALCVAAVGVGCAKENKQQAAIINQQQARIAFLQTAVSNFSTNLAYTAWERDAYSNQCNELNQILQAPENGRASRLGKLWPALSNSVTAFVGAVELEGMQAQWAKDKSFMETNDLLKDLQINMLRTRVDFLKTENSNLVALNEKTKKILQDRSFEEGQKALTAQMNADRQALNSEIQADAAEDAAWALQRQADALERMNFDMEFNSLVRPR